MKFEPDATFPFSLSWKKAGLRCHIASPLHGWRWAAFADSKRIGRGFKDTQAEAEAECRRIVLEHAAALRETADDIEAAVGEAP